MEVLAYQGTGATQPSPSKKAVVIGWIIGALPGAMLVFSAAMKFAKPEAVIKGFEHLGWPERYALPLGILELACVIVYLIPSTAVLGAILITGYMGGAIATHVRLGEPIYTHVVIGMLFWLGLYLRDPRLRDLIPIRKA